MDPSIFIFFRINTRKLKTSYADNIQYAGQFQSLVFCKIFFTIFFLCNVLSIRVQSQTPAIDSLKKELDNPQSNKLSTLFELCWRGESMPAKDYMMFAQKAKQISIQNNDKTSRLQSEFFIARCYNIRGRADTALLICNAGLKETDPNEMFDQYREFMWYKIASLTKLRKIKESIDECFKLLEAGETHNDVSAKVIAYNNLGANNVVLGNRIEALAWLNKAYDLIKDNVLYKKFALVFTNLSAEYFSVNKTDSGFYFLHYALAIAKENQNLRNQADCFTIMGLVYTLQNKTDSAEQMLKQAVAIQKKIGNIQYILVGLEGLEAFYAKQKKYQQAIDCIKEAENYSRQYQEPLTLPFYKDLADYYKQLKNYDAYGETMDRLMLMKDSLFQKSKAEDLAKLEAQYDLTSKEAFIAKQKLEILHKNIWEGITILVILIIAALTYLFFRRNRRRQIMALNDAEEKERKRIAADLHDNIGAYASAISAGIDEIENKKLITDDSSIHNLKNNATEIITSLRDTIWAFNKESVTLTGISDRIKIYTQKIQPAYPHIQISVEENITKEKKLSPVQALHIFRIMQEALQNALRHSDCKNVTINIIGNDESMSISIEDNGNGFDPAKVQHAGNGLINMKTRAAEAGLILSIEKIISGGTKVLMVGK